VKEIWGGILKELPEVHVLPRGWFALNFAKENYMDLVLAKFWHIEMAPVLLKRWSPLFDPEREQIGARPLWVRLPGLPSNIGLKKFSSTLEMPWELISTTIAPSWNQGIERLLGYWYT